VEARAQTDRGLWSTIFGSDEIIVDAGNVGAPVLIASDAVERLSVSPNPARSDVALTWRAPAGPVRLTIFDAAGRRVFERASDDSEGRLSWNGRGANGMPVSAGVYLVQLQAEGVSTSSRLVLVR
jgi:hypothetical protein